MPVKRIAIVTDSTADIPTEVQKQLDIHVVPLFVIFGETSYRDGEDITSKTFFEMLPKSQVHPRTSQPSPGDFSAVYERLLATHDEVLSLHISSALSGTYQSAVLARDTLATSRITVLDSRSASLGLGLAVVAAAEARNAGLGLPEIMAATKRVCEQQTLLISVDTLEYLRRNGRIGKASVLLGTLLKVHPILRLVDGAITPHAKIRGKMSKVLQSMIEAAGEFVPHGREVQVAIVHGNCLERALELKALLQKSYRVSSVLTNVIGPVIGVHVGPGTIGLIVVPK
ncbi:MAG: DegV domain-containing protein [Firmicutes bacterium]|nr:DegV domain-containing protein [candidate division NPL-UPA2 bacterium]